MWQIEHQQAIWKSRRLTAHLDLNNPAAGLRPIRYGAAEWSQVSLHQISLPGGNNDSLEFLDDAYVRENDVIVTFRESAATAIRAQLQWRVRELADAMVLLELTASVQTAGRDCDPRIRLATSVPTGCWRCWDGQTQSHRDIAIATGEAGVSIPVSAPGAALFSQAEKVGLCLGQIVPAADLVAASLEPDSTSAGSTLALTYFANRLEKGVLRRVRVQACLLPQASVWPAFTALAAESLRQAPPLVA